MPRVSLEIGLAVGGIILTIILVVLDKAGKLIGPTLFWLLVLAALMTVPLALGNPLVADAPGVWKWWSRGIMLALVGFGYWAIAIWISPEPLSAPSGGENKPAQTASQPTSQAVSPNIPDRQQEIIDNLNAITALLTGIPDPAYRDLVANVIHAFEPKAYINVGPSIEGPDGARKIDVGVRSVGERPTFTAVDIVDLPVGRKAGIEFVDAADSKRLDIKADAMLICSNTGFDAIAIRKAKRKKIVLISILHRGDKLVKAIIEEEVYLRKIWLGPKQVTYEWDGPSPDFNFQADDLRYQKKSVVAWLEFKAMLVASQANLEQYSLRFRFKQPTDFQARGRSVRVRSLSIAFTPKTQWLSQVVQLDAATGIYDYLRGRVQLAGGSVSYFMNNINFDTATPLPFPPAINDRGIGLQPGEPDIKLAMVEDTNVTNQADIPNLDDIVNPEDLTALVAIMTSKH